MTAKKYSRHFTVEEVREILDEVRPLVREMVDLYTEVSRLGYNVYRHHYFTGNPANGEKYHEKELAIVGILDRLSHMGLLIKSVDRGLIDFPAVRANGEEVYICWHLGEEDVGFWHGLDDGFLGRRPITEF